MPITPEHSGRSYPPVQPYRVSRAKIHEFAAALGEQSPWCLGDDPVAPPTFAALIAASAWEVLFDDPELGVALNRTIHADQSFTYQRPLREGDDVVAQLTIEKVRNRGNLDIITISVELSIEGEPVCTARSTLIHTREQESAA